MTDAPKRIVAWPGISGWLCGTWSQTRYPEDGQVYTRADLIDMDVLRQFIERLKPFSDMAGEMFARNWNDDGVAISFVTKDGPMRLTFKEFRELHYTYTDLRAMMEKINE